MKRKSHKAQIFSLIFAAAFPGTAQAGIFPFAKYAAIKSGKDFSIISSTKGRIGSGHLSEISSKRLALKFSARLTALAIQGQMSLTPVLCTAKGQVFLLRYEGTAGGRKETSEEKVTVPHYLLKRGILSFSYHKGKRFFQLGINKQGHTMLITDWGAARLSQTES